MTNRSKAAKANGPLRFLDLSFDSQPPVPSGEDVNNGVRPHGGYRGRKKHPPSPLSFDKTREYHEKLREDIDRLLEEDNLKVHGSPAWAGDASREIHHGGESALIANRFLSASRREVPKSGNSKRRTESARTRKTPPQTREGVTYYRPNRTHQYLTTTELKDYAQGDTNIKHGRPTRTTLLRARQRSSSAPINAYDVRRELTKRAEERRAKSNQMKNKQDSLLNFQTTSGESQHSWLIGARYNSARCVDVKSLTLYGPYTPRKKPMECLHANSLTNLLKDENTAPPDSDLSDDDGELLTSHIQRVRSAPVIRKPSTNQPPPVTRNAWDEPAVSIPEIKEDETIEKVDRDIQVMEEFIVMPDGLNVKGSRVFVPRSETTKKSVLPVVQGISWRSPRRKEKSEDNISQPPPPTPVGLLSSKTDQTEKLKLDELITKRSYSSRGPPSDKSPTEVTKDDPKLSAPKKIKPILVDRSVNVPSVSGDSTKNEMRQEVIDNPLILPILKTESKTDAMVEVEENGEKYEEQDTTLSSPLEPGNAQNTPVGSGISSPSFPGEIAKEEVVVSSAQDAQDETGEQNETTEEETPKTGNESPSETASKNKADNDNGDNVAFFLTEEDESNDKDDSDNEQKDNVREKSEPLTAIPEEQAENTDEVEHRHGEGSEGQADSKLENIHNEELDDIADKDPSVDLIENDDETSSLTPVIQVTVDISKKKN